MANNQTRKIYTRKCLHCGRKFEENTGVTADLCSNSCKQILETKRRIKMREILGS